VVAVVVVEVLLLLAVLDAVELPALVVVVATLLPVVVAELPALVVVVQEDVDEAFLVVVLLDDLVVVGQLRPNNWHKRLSVRASTPPRLPTWA
jgi:hypothetical protein